MNLAVWLQRTAQLFPDRPALMQGTRLVADYREFARRSRAIAGYLSAQEGIVPGDRVAIFAKNSTAYLELLYAIWHAGAVAVPINAKLHVNEAVWIVENAGATLLFADAGVSGEVQISQAGLARIRTLGGPEFEAMYRASETQEPVSRDANDLAWLFYTSGTTGKPKGVMLTNGNLHAMAFSYFVDVDNVFPDDAALYAAPISHGAGIYNFQHVMKGARHVVPASAGFDPAEILDLAKDLGSVHIFAAPTMVKRLVEEAKVQGRAGQGLRTIVYGGGPMYLEDIVEAVDVLGSRFCQIYGQGESPMTITALPRETIADRTHPRWRERLASVGTAQSCVDVHIVDESGHSLPAGETGEIVVKGSPVMAGYWNNQSATGETLRDGWLWTGDMGSLDEEGFLTLKDRSKDVIISGGTNIYPREIEEVLLAVPGVHEISVVGQRHAEWGEIVAAFVVAQGDAEVSAEMLDAHCLDNIARFKRPKTYRFVDALPKNNYGKVLKTELRRLLENEE
ncbi:AMP-binding protein [Hoeflea prorocentri]|uniref:3-methylmercaptopropionyl-CoA ligase n=1 Tax=Hoeflea prorocentri TaxID=1922333 RepID=A0A9X3UI69_9HYPH|nr:AMP-binding protein [Hoeflea prorocentri]MCY6380885.1 AMP-binding protein [Hoeflea prorocentri]MDA5398685.1 AMP-binding protein [Hoeflea prorocentri]